MQYRNYTIRRGDTLSLSFSSLGDISTRDTLWFTVKTRASDPADSASTIMVVEELGTAGTAGGNGLLYLNGSIAATPENGEIDVTNATAGNLTVTVAAVETAKITSGNVYVWDLQMCDTDGVVTTLASGAMWITGDVTRATCD